MWLPAHAAIGYIIGRKTAVDTRWCVVGSVFPDLIDKTLGHLGVFPAYQTVSHSLLGMIIIGLLVAFHYSRSTLAFYIGWLAHLMADVVQLTINGRSDHALNILGWPILHWENPMVINPETAYHEGIFASVPFVQEGYVLHYLTTPSFYVEFVIMIYAFWLVYPQLHAWRFSTIRQRTQSQR